MLGRLPVDRHPMLRLIQQEADFPWLKIFHAQQMPVWKIVATGKPGLAHSGLHGCGLLQRRGKLKWGKREMPDTDRKRCVWGKRVSVRVDRGGRRIIKK